MSLGTEQIRGCGWRKVGGIYLIGGIMNKSCDRLPITLTVCDTCGAGIKVGKGFTKINPLKLWGHHAMNYRGCKDPSQCYVCFPDGGIGYMMRCGEKFYTMDSFIEEARDMGVSKRIPFIPKDLEVNKTPVFLVHKKAGWEYAEELTNETGQERIIVPCDGIFSAFIPTHIEQLVWAKDLKGKNGKALRERLEKRGITIVEVADGDRDHDPNVRKKKTGGISWKELGRRLTRNRRSIKGEGNEKN